MNIIHPTNQTNHRQMISSESLAYWFLRLNGFMTTVNFVVHPDRGGNQRTDVDILGCRFPYRSELFENPMIDHEIFTSVRDKMLIVIAEVKRSQCRLNGPWTQPERENIQRVLRAIGIAQENEVHNIADNIYRFGFYDNHAFRISLLCVGDHQNRDLTTEYPDVPQLTWSRILTFIYNRFRAYRRQKSAHHQWDGSGQLLWDNARNCRDVNEYIAKFDIQ